MEHYVIIIGAMKSGTTTLFDLLAQHPQVAPAHPKEPGFFAFNDINARGFGWYHDLFDFDPKQHKYRLDGSTDYTKAPFVTGVWDRMKARPNARYKLIYIMRDPIKRLQSHARHVQMRKKEVGQIISEQLNHSLDHGISLASLAMTQYAQQLDQFAEPYRNGDVHLTTLEELTQNPQCVLSDIAAFLDLPSDGFADQTTHSNAAGNQAVVRDSWAKMTENEALLSLGKKLLPGAARQKIKSAFTKKLSAEGRFRFTPQEEQVVRDLLKEDLGRLGTDYGVEMATRWVTS